MGEKFLHVYAGSDIFEEISDLLDEVAEANLPIVRELIKMFWVERLGLT